MAAIVLLPNIFFEFPEPNRNVETQSLEFFIQEKSIASTLGTVSKPAQPPTPVQAFPPTTDGIIACSHWDQIKERVIQVPYCNDVGRFTEDEEAETVLWNTFEFDDVQVVQIDSDDCPGIVLDGIDVFDIILHGEALTITWEIEGISAGAGAFECFITVTFENLTTTNQFEIVFCLIGERFAPPSLMLANYAANVKVSSRWLTRIDNSRDVLESRRGLVSRPQRVVNFTLQGMTREDTSVLDIILNRLGDGPTFAPLYTDHTRLTAPVAIDDTVIPCDTRWRRLAIGSDILIGTPQNCRSLFSYEEQRTIIDITDSSITVDRPLDQSHPVGARVYPALYVHPTRNSRMRLQTDHHGAGSFQIFETRGPTALPATFPRGIASSADPDQQAFIDSFNTLNGYPVLDIVPDWSTNPATGYRRPGRDVTLGFGRVFELLGPRPRYFEQTLYTFLSREEAWRMVKFFDWRGGSLFPFYVVSHRDEFTIVEILQDRIRVEPLWGFEEWRFKPFVGIINKDGTHEVKAIFDIQRNAGVDEIFLADPFPVLPGPNDFRRVTVAHLVRFDNDEMRETWITDEHMTAQATLLELVDERDFPIANLPDAPEIGDPFDRPEPDGQCPTLTNPVFP